MGLRYTAARAISSASTWGLKHVFRRPAANFPGKFALYADPAVIGHCKNRLTKGSICVVGTNGKTTTNNLIADALVQAGQTVACNRTGANLDSGVATTMLQTKQADWGVLECDELWLAKILPHLQADYVLLLNLFRDQLDRAGEIDIIQKSIMGALESSPSTVLVYNADDPLCTAIACGVKNRSIAFGIDEDMHLAQNTVVDAQVCQQCSNMLEYEYRQYGQLGSYQCPSCGFQRPTLDYWATGVNLRADGLGFTLNSKDASYSFDMALQGAYMVYNLLAVAVMASLLGCPFDCVQQAARAFAPNNGRLEHLTIGDRPVLMNLAKNPTGFNQNLKIVLSDDKPFVLGLFINDKEADGHDISWLWDIDFEELAARPDARIYAGGIRKNDMQMRLKYAGVPAGLVESPEELMACAQDLPEGCGVYAIANYTALPEVKSGLEALAASSAAGEYTPAAAPASTAIAALPEMPEPAEEPPVVIAHLFPDLLNLYGDGGNVKVLETRLRWRGIPVEVRRVHHGESIDLSQADLVFMGGGPDREQKLASAVLMEMAQDLQTFVDGQGALLAICGGYQILGSTWLLGEDQIPGLNIADLSTGRDGTSRDRMIDNIGLRVEGIQHPVVGYENHAGCTNLGPTAEPFGRVISTTGHGNNLTSKQDGVRFKGVIGTYLHGPLLGKNPEVADMLLTTALAHRAQRCGISKRSLIALDDRVELEANSFMAQRMGANR